MLKACSRWKQCFWVCQTFWTYVIGISVSDGNNPGYVTWFWLVDFDWSAVLIGWNLFLSLAPGYHFYAVVGKNFGHYRPILDQSQVDSALDELELDVWNNFNKRLLNDKWLLGTKLIINYYWNYSHISNVCWNFIILVITIFSLKSKFKKYYATRSLNLPPIERMIFISFCQGDSIAKHCCI